MSGDDFYKKVFHVYIDGIHPDHATYGHWGILIFCQTYNEKFFKREFLGKFDSNNIDDIKRHALFFALRQIKRINDVRKLPNDKTGLVFGIKLFSDSENIINNYNNIIKRVPPENFSKKWNGIYKELSKYSVLTSEGILIKDHTENESSKRARTLTRTSLVEEIKNRSKTK